MPVFDIPLNTNDQSIDRVINAGLPVLLVAYRGALPNAVDDALKQIARAEAGNLLVAKLDATANPQTAAQLSGTLPALVAYQHGETVASVGGFDAAALYAYADFLAGRGPRPAVRTSAPESARTNGSAASSSAPTKPVTVSDATFEREVLQSELPVLVDLWAPWCAPCRMIAPVVEKLAAEYAGRLKVVKLNVDENPQVSLRYQVQGIPTLLIFHNGKVADRLVGAAPEPMLRSHVDAVLMRAG